MQLFGGRRLGTTRQVRLRLPSCGLHQGTQLGEARAAQRDFWVQPSELGKRGEVRLRIPTTCHVIGTYIA